MVRNKGRRLSRYVADYVVFDLETTGIRQNLDRIIEISAVKVRGHKVTEQYTTLVAPKCIFQRRQPQLTELPMKW